MFLHPISPKLHQVSRQKNFGLVLVDLTVPNSKYLTYPYRRNRDNGDVDFGLREVRRLIDFSEAEGIPIFFVRFGSNVTVIDSLLRDLRDPIFANKFGYSAFCKVTVREPSFETLLMEEGVDTLIVSGFNRVCCVRRTIADALLKGYGVYTSDSVMFGHAQYDRQRDVSRAIRYFKANTNYHNTVDDLIAAVRMELAMKGVA